MTDVKSVDILLVGQPNVGKSVLFSKLTGINTVSSNYAGTTVSYSQGSMEYGGVLYSVIDAPGAYSLEPLDDAARVTLDLIDKCRLIINVLDSTHLERNLTLTLELLEQGKPVVVVLNMSDEARHKGINIDYKKLSEKLGVLVIPTVARTGVGIKELVTALSSTKMDTPKEVDNEGHPWHHPHIPKHNTSVGQPQHKHMDRDSIWERIGKIIAEVQILNERKHTALEVLEDLSVHPVWGVLIAFFALVISFSAIRLVGEGLISGTSFVFSKFWLPLMYGLHSYLGEGSFLSKMLIGTLVDGKIVLEQSYGLLTSGVYIPLGVVLPYVFSFYFVISMLEDTGYLPRLAVFLDGVMHKIGLHGYAVIPTILGMGCNVPGILATRILETPRQRFVVATMISIAVPCVSMQAMLIGVVGNRGIIPLMTVYGALIITWFIVGFILRITAKEYQPELLIEIPPYRIPDWKSLFAKMWTRSYGFIVEALPVIMISIFVVDLLYQTAVFTFIADVSAPVVQKLWGLPKDAIIPLLIGILRKDAAVAMFPTIMTTKQLVTASIVLAMFFPCVASFVILVKELGWKYTAKSIALMLICVLVAGVLANLIL